MKYNKRIIFSLIYFLSFQQLALCVEQSDLKAPIQESESQENLPSQIDLSIIPTFPKFGAATGGKRISASDTTIPLNTSLKIVIDNFIDSKTAMVGDYFKAHVLEDFYISTDTPQLVLPKGSWVRGRISFLKRPNFFIKTAKISIHLDQLVTPLGETLVLDSELDIQKGILGQNGLLKPLLVKQADAQVWTDSTLTVPISNLGPPLIGSLLTGKLYALFTESDSVTLNKGQELQIVLQRNLQLTAN